MEHKPIIGTMIRMVRNPAIANIAKNAGLDMIMLDGEHGNYSLSQMADIFGVARSAGLAVFVRVPQLSRECVSGALDCGATGVMVPMVESVDQARDFVKWAKYPPLGNRGFGSIGGHTDYAGVSNTSKFMAKANAETMTIAQIESVEGVAAVDEIAAVNGIDALLVGPNDLSISLGCPGDFTCEEETKAIEKIAQAAAKNNKIFGMHAGVELLEKWIPYGMTLIMNNLEVNLLTTGMAEIKSNMEKLLRKGQ